MCEAAITTIQGFIKLIEDKDSAFSPQSWEALPEINNELDQLDDKANLFQVSQIILAWTKQHFNPEGHSALSNASKADTKDRINFKNKDKSQPIKGLLENRSLTPEEKLELRNQLYQTIENTQNQSPPQS